MFFAYLYEGAQLFKPLYYIPIRALMVALIENLKEPCPIKSIQVIMEAPGV